MNKIEKGSIWKNKETGQTIRVLDCGVWVMDVNDKNIKKTLTPDQLLNEFELESLTK